LVKKATFYEKTAKIKEQSFRTETEGLLFSLPIKHRFDGKHKRGSILNVGVKKQFKKIKDTESPISLYL